MRTREPETWSSLELEDSEDTEKVELLQEISELLLEHDDFEVELDPETLRVLIFHQESQLGEILIRSQADASEDKDGENLVYAIQVGDEDEVIFDYADDSVAHILERL